MPVGHRTAILAVAASASLALLGAVASGAAADAKAAADKGSVVIFGSSSINDSFGHLIAEDFARLGFDVVRRGYAAAGLSRPDFRDVNSKLKDLPINRDTRSVLLYFGGNDAQPLWLRRTERKDASDEWVKWDDQRWSHIYEKRAEKLIDAICARGAHHVIVLPPADVRSTRMQHRLDRIRALQRVAAKASRCGRFVPTGGDRGELGAGPEPLRAEDGVHMSRQGARRVWKRIRTKVLELIRS